jgi:hypothetical protein
MPDSLCDTSLAVGLGVADRTGVFVGDTIIVGEDVIVALVLVSVGVDASSFT